MVFKGCEGIFSIDKCSVGLTCGISEVEGYNWLCDDCLRENDKKIISDIVKLRDRIQNKEMVNIPHLLKELNTIIGFI